MAFVVAARFRTSKRAHAIYTQVERALYQGEESDLSAYNLILDGVPLVVVLGDHPPAQVQEQLAHLLATGQTTDLPADVVATLRRRREQEQGKGRWIEGVRLDTVQRITTSGSWNKEVTFQGQSPYLETKVKEDKSMVIKQDTLEDVYDAVLQGPRDTVKAVLLEVQSPVVEVHTPR